jgi:heme exporter protein D
MSASNMALIEMAFSAAVVLTFCVWQLVSVNRDIRKRKAREAEEARIRAALERREP